MSEAKKSELAIRDKAILHQQRRLKQATQFTHKDSADLLPLDGLKRLGTSKDLVSGPDVVCLELCRYLRKSDEVKSLLSLLHVLCLRVYYLRSRAAVYTVLNIKLLTEKLMKHSESSTLHTEEGSSTAQLWCRQIVPCSWRRQSSWSTHQMTDSLQPLRLPQPHNTSRNNLNNSSLDLSDTVPSFTVASQIRNNPCGTVGSAVIRSCLPRSDE